MSNMVVGYETGEGSTPKKRSKPISEVWEHFTKLRDVNGGMRAKCKYCHTDLSYTMGTTSHLGRHLASCSKAPKQVGAQFSKRTKRNIISEPLEKAKKEKTAGINQPPTIAFPEEIRNFDLTSEKIWEAQVKNAILADFPFAPPYVKKAWSSLMVMDMEKEICAYHHRQKEKLITELGDLTSRVSFSCEIIEAGWISISAHFVNNDFKLVKRLIGFKKVNFETPNSRKVDIIERCISDWKLEDKIFTINTRWNEDLHKFLKEKFSTKSFLEEEDMVFYPLREQVASYYFFRLKNSYSVEKDKIIKFFQDALETKIKMSKFNAIAKEMGLSPIDEDWLKRQPTGWYWETQVWKFCCSVAKLFKDALIYKAVIFKCALTETGEAPVSEVDPQSICWQKLKQEVDYFMFESDDGAQNVFKTREFFETLFVVHARKGTNGSAGTTDTQDDIPLRIPSIEDSFTEGFRLYLKNLKTIDRSEMNKYLMEETVDIGDEHFDLLNWWKENSLHYPVLSRMARTVLAIPVCAYSVEEDLGLDLSVLKAVNPELVEAVICSKDWILTNA